MNLKLNSRRDQGTIILVIILVLVFTIVFVGLIATAMIKAIHKLKPAPEKNKNEDGSWKNAPPLGSALDGGIVDGYIRTFHTNTIAPAPAGFVIDVIHIYAGPTLDSLTNFVCDVDAFNIDDTIGVDGIPIEQFPNGKPPQRFYQQIVEGHFE